MPSLNRGEPCGRPSAAKSSPSPPGPAKRSMTGIGALPMTTRAEGTGSAARSPMSSRRAAACGVAEPERGPGTIASGDLEFGGGQGFGFQGPQVQLLGRPVDIQADQVAFLI